MEMDWTAAGAIITGAVATVGTGIGAGLKLLLGHLKAREEAAQKHEREVMEEVKAIARDFNATTKEQASRAREDSQNTIKLLMEVQSETVGAVGNLSKEVHTLGLAITEMRGELAKKQDRGSEPPEGPAKGRRHQ